MTQDNPYAAPQALDVKLVQAIDASSPLAVAEAERKEYIKHEVSVKSIAYLYGLGILGSLALCGLWSYTLATKQVDAEEQAAILFGLGITVPLLLVALPTVYWLRVLDPKAKIGSAILSGLGLLNVPFGTLLNGYVLYLVFSTKGAKVFSPEYKAIIAQTPHVAYKSSIWPLVILVLLIAAIAALVVL